MTVFSEEDLTTPVPGRELLLRRFHFLFKLFDTPVMQEIIHIANQVHWFASLEAFFRK